MIAFYEDNTGGDGNSGNGAVAAANRVYALLEVADPQIHQHLLAMGVEPQLFLLRWLRLLFGREFHQEDVLVMWDRLFTVLYRLGEPNFLTQLVEAFAVAMVLFVRPALIAYSDMHQVKRYSRATVPSPPQFSYRVAGYVSSHGSHNDHWLCHTSHVRPTRSQTVKPVPCHSFISATLS